MKNGHPVYKRALWVNRWIFFPENSQKVPTCNIVFENIYILTLFYLGLSASGGAKGSEHPVYWSNFIKVSQTVSTLNSQLSIYQPSNIEIETEFRNSCSPPHVWSFAERSFANSNLCWYYESRKVVGGRKYSKYIWNMRRIVKKKIKIP